MRNSPQKGQRQKWRSKEVRRPARIRPNPSKASGVGYAPLKEGRKSVEDLGF